LEQLLSRELLQIHVIRHDLTAVDDVLRHGFGFWVALIHRESAFHRIDLIGATKNHKIHHCCPLHLHGLGTVIGCITTRSKYERESYHVLHHRTYSKWDCIGEAR